MPSKRTLLVPFAIAGSAFAKSNATRPFRGWTSWDLSAVTNSAVYGKSWLNAANMMAILDALAVSPLQAIWSAESVAPYVNVDSFWANDPTQQVDAFGRWSVNTARFPQGMEPIGDYIHANGQLFGIYLNPGVAVAAVKQKSPIENTSCTADQIAWYPLTGGNTFGDTYRVNFSHPCAQPYFDSFARLLASWGVDFLKLDAVSPGSDVNTPPASGGIDNRPDIAAWSAALEKTGRDIWFTLSWRINASYAADWAPHANAWRTSDDIDCYCNVLSNWDSALKRFYEVQPWLDWLPSVKGAAGGGYPDLDSLNVGQGDLDGLTPDQKQTSVTLWALTGGPLYTGNDLTVPMDAYGLMLLTNPEVLAVNSVGVRPSLSPASAGGKAPQQVWMAPDPDGISFIVAMFNLAPNASEITVSLEEAASAVQRDRAGLAAWMAVRRGEGPVSSVTAPAAAAVGAGKPLTMDVRDLWLRADLGDVEGKFTATLPPFGSRLLRFTPKQ